MKKLLMSLTAASLLLGTVITCDAATFAQFFQQVNATTPFVFTGGQTGTLSVSNLPVFFQFKDNGGVPFIMPAPINMNINALLTFSATANGTAPMLGAGSASQNFASTTFTFTSQTNQTVGGIFIPAGTVLLSGTAFPGGFGFPVAGTLSGQNGGNGATYVTTDTPPPFSNDLVFSSAYLNFAGAMQDTASYSFSNVTPMYSYVPGPPPSPPLFLDTSFIAAFTAQGAGTFSANAVPEPGSLALLTGLGVTGTAFAFSRLRRRRR